MKGLTSLCMLLLSSTGCALALPCQSSLDCPDGSDCDARGRCIAGEVAAVVDAGGPIDASDAGIALIETDAGVIIQGNAVARDVIGYTVRKSSDEIARVTNTVPLVVENLDVGQTLSHFEIVAAPDVVRCAATISVTGLDAELHCDDDLLGDVRATYRAVLDDGRASTPGVVTLRFLPSDWHAVDEGGLPVRAQRMRLDVDDTNPSVLELDGAVFALDHLFPSGALSSADSFDIDGDPIGRELAAGGAFHEIDEDYTWLYFDELVVDAQDDAAVLWEDYSAVWHLDQDAREDASTGDGRHDLRGSVTVSPIGGALDGAVAVPASVLSADVTVSSDEGSYSAWLFIPQTIPGAQTGPIVCATFASGIKNMFEPNISLGLFEDTPFVGVNTGERIVAAFANARLSKGAWHHIAGTWRHDDATASSTVTIYVDGELVAAEDASEETVAVFPTVRLGRTGDSQFDQLLFAFVDDVRVATRARDALDIRLEYESATQPVLSGVAPRLSPVAALTTVDAAPNTTLIADLIPDERDGALFVAIASALPVESISVTNVDVLERDDMRLAGDIVTLSVFRCSACRPTSGTIAINLGSGAASDVVMTAVQIVGRGQTPIAPVANTGVLTLENTGPGAFLAAFAAGTGAVTTSPGGYRVFSRGTARVLVDAIVVPVDPTLMAADTFTIAAERDAPGALLGYHLQP